MNKLSKLFFIMVLMSLLGGCASSLTIRLHAARQLNLNAEYKSLPVQVRIYQLQDKQTFMQASFHELWQEDKATLGDDLLGKHEVTVNPNVTTKVVLPYKDNCHYLGVVAIFRKPTANNWRVLYHVPANVKILSFGFHAKLHRNKISKGK